MAGNDDRFTGGDALTPGTLEHDVHQAMMSNELSGGRGAYRISNAVLAASGPSYGAFQYDLGGNARARELFEEIATTAVDAQGNRFISDRDLETIRNNLYQPFSRIEADPAAQQAYDRLRPAMNAALDSETGRRLINEDYVAGVDAKVEALNATIAAVPDAGNRAFLEQNRLAQLIILDTANQYGPAVNRGLRDFMGMDAQDDSMAMPGRRTAEQIGVNGSFGIEEMIRYKLETQYGQNDAGARDVLRRISNLVDAAGRENITLSEEDQTFLASGLRQYLVDNGRNPEMLNHRDLRGLRDLGVGTDRALQLNDTGRDVTALQEDLRRLGYAAGSDAAGTFDATTQAAVEALQRDRGLAETGVADQSVFNAIDQTVRALQQDLNDLGYKDARDRPLSIDGDFGPGTTHALQALQRDGGLEPTGVANEETLGAIATRLPDARTAALEAGQVTGPAPIVPQEPVPVTPAQTPAEAPAIVPPAAGDSGQRDGISTAPAAVDAPAVPAASGVTLTSAYELTQQYDHVKYGFGARDPDTGKVDCSGWVIELVNSSMAEVNEQAGRDVFSKADRFGPGEDVAASIVEKAVERSGVMLEGRDVNASNLREGMVIGEDNGQTDWDHGRFEGIDHITMVVRDPTDGQLKISQSRGGEGVELMPLQEYLDGKSRAQTELFATDPLHAARDLIQEQGQVQGPITPNRPADAEVDAPREAGQPLLREDSRGSAVRSLQESLNELGYSDAAGRALDADSIFGPRTEHAVRAFQQDKGLDVDGIVGPETRAALEQAREQARAGTAPAQCGREADSPSAATPALSGGAFLGSLFAAVKEGDIGQIRDALSNLSDTTVGRAFEEVRQSTEQRLAEQTASAPEKSTGPAPER